MHTETLFRASAEVVTITSLAEGDVYKRVDADYSGKAGLRFGIVTSVMNNGTDTAITAVEFDPGYNGVTSRLAVMRGGGDVALFAATPAEVESHLDELLNHAARAVDTKRRELDEAIAARERVTDLFKDHARGRLNAPATSGVIDAETVVADHAFEPSDPDEDDAPADTCAQCGVLQGDHPAGPDNATCPGGC